MRRALVPGDFKETRSEPRTPCVRQIDILPCMSAKNWHFIPAELRDCSPHGLAIVMSDRMEEGQEFLVKLSLPRGVKLLIYTVENCTTWERSRFRIGARFSGFAAQEVEEDLETVLAALAKAN